MHLFDASAIISLVKKGKLKVFMKGSTLDLAVYETVNAILKECLLLGRIRVETAYKFTEVLSKVFNILEILNIRGYEKEVVDLAIKEGITVYDASYLYIAMLEKATLVTDDGKLLNTARKYVAVKTTAELST